MKVKINNPVRDKKAMTLVEVLAAMALLAIIVLGFSVMFVFSVSAVKRAGARITTDYTVSSVIENRLAGLIVTQGSGEVAITSPNGTITIGGVTYSETSDTQMSTQFGATNVTMTGKTGQANMSESGAVSTIHFFLPDR